jgi:ParB/RepB/Spo0J family partition protein
MATTAQAPKLNEHFEMIALAAIAESKTNPRKSYSDKGMAELTASILQKGILVPIILRPHPKPSKAITHEIVVGSRRFRAAAAAKKSHVPALIRNYSDEQMLEVQIIENLQREDVHPLEEAEGFALLLKQSGYTAEVIAEKIGHDVGYVQKRLAFCKLTDELRQDFAEDRINIGHATLLARLPQDKQTLARKELLYTQASEFVEGKGWVKGDVYAIAVNKLDHAIRENLFTDLSTVSWDKDDATLIPKAGACSTCPKHSGANRALFDEFDSKLDICLDFECFTAKADAQIVKVIAIKKSEGVTVSRISPNYTPADKAALDNHSYTLVAEGKGKGKKSGGCDSVTQGIYVEGPGKGTIVDICKDKQCRIHNVHNYSSGHSASAAGKKDFWTARAEKLETNIKTAVRRAQITAILDKGATAFKWGVPADKLRIIALSVLGHNSIEPELLDCLKVTGVATEKMHGTAAREHLDKLIRSAKGDTELERIITALTLEPWAKEYAPYAVSGKHSLLDMAVEAFGVNGTKIANDVGMTMRTEFNEKRKKSEDRKAAKEKPKTAKATPPAKTAKHAHAPKAAKEKPKEKPKTKKAPAARKSAKK